MDDDRQNFDNAAWDKNEEAEEKDNKRLRSQSTCDAMESLVNQWCGKHASLKPPLIAGGYNVIYRMQFEENLGDDVVVRVPFPAMVQFPLEKTIAEVATMKFIKEKTSIPVPEVYHYECSTGKSDTEQFIIIPYIPNSDSLSDTLTDPKWKEGGFHSLDPNIAEEKLENLYSQMAEYLLQLSQQHFPFIGSLSTTGQNAYSVTGRPISVNMNNMLQLANIPPSILPPKDKTYKTADEWYLALARMHIAQLTFQHNDLVFTPDDCRNKYIARFLFRKLAKKGHLSIFGFAEDDWSTQSHSHRSSPLSPAPSNSDYFRIWCDDLRAGNVLMGKDDPQDIVSIIDWEFAYVAPSQFALDPPWWLLLEQPEYWSGGIENWREVYETRLKTWLRAMEKVEAKTGVTEKLSQHMRESWETGRFWLNYAARKSWVFDSIYWKYLDERFFGSRANSAAGNVDHNARWKTRIDQLSARENKAMETFVERKMEESKDRILIDWDPEKAKVYLVEVLSGCDVEEVEELAVSLDRKVHLD